MSAIHNSAISSDLMCKLPNGDVFYSASFATGTHAGKVCTMVKLFSLGNVFLGAAGGHVPQMFGSVPGQVCAKFQGLGLADGQYYVELQLNEGTSLKSHVQFSSALKSSSPKALKHFAQVGQAVDAMMSGTNHPFANAFPVAQSIAPTVVQAHAATVSTSKPKKVNLPIPAYNYHVDGIIGGVLEGWIWCPHYPERRYEVQAWCGERLVGYGTAEIFREDLYSAGKADGKIKFELPLARHLFDGKSYKLTVVVIGQGELDNNQTLVKNLDFNSPSRPQRTNKNIPIVDYEKAIENVKKYEAVALNKKAWLMIQKALLHFYNLELKLAKLFIEEILNELHVPPEIKIKYSEILLLEKKYIEAEGLYKNMLWIYGEQNSILLGMLCCAYHRDSNAEALILCDKILNENPACTYAMHIKTSLESNQTNLSENNKKISLGEEKKIAPSAGRSQTNPIAKKKLNSNLVEPRNEIREFIENSEVIEKISMMVKLSKKTDC